MAGNQGPNQEQVDIANAFNEALKESSSIFDKVAESATSASEKINDALKAAGKYFDRNEDRISQSKELTEALKKQQEQQEDSNDLISKAAKKLLPDYLDVNSKHVRILGALTVAYSGVQEGIEGTLGIFRLFQSGIMGGISIIQGAVGVITGIFSALWSASSDYYNNHSRAVFVANQALVESFGNLKGPTGSMVKSFGTSLAGAQDTLAASGRSLYTVLGDTAERIAALGEIGKAFGEMLPRLGHHAVEAAGSMMLLNKGMGVSYETMKVMAVEAEAMGGTLQEELDTVAVASAHMANQFGLDVKDIGKGFNSMAADSAHFGDMTSKELVSVAAYASKLGVEIKNLTGMMDQFDTFESAAQSAGMLAEAFGMNIDAMGMMMSDNPAERIDELRRAFQNTGKSVADLSRHELKLLSQQMGGMDLESMKNALSIPVDELGFDDFEDAMGDAEEKMSVQDATIQMAESIKKLETAFTNLGKGPLQSFVIGFDKIVTLNGTFREMLNANNEYLLVFQQAGMDIANTIASWLGGLGDVRKAFGEFYNLQGAKDMFASINEGLKDFLQLLKTDPAKAGREFMELIIDEASEYLSGVGGGQLTGGFKDLGAKIVIAVGEMAIPLIEKISSILTDVASFISGGGVESGIKDATESGLGGALLGAMTNIFDSLKTSLLPALADLFWALFDKIKPFLITALITMWTAVLIKSIVTALLQQALISAALGGFNKFMGTVSEGVNTANNTGAGPAQDASSSIMESLSSAVDTAADMEPTNIKKAGKNLGMSALYFLGPLLAYSLAAIGIAKVYQASSIELKDMIGAFTAIGGSILAMIGVVKATEKMGNPNYVSIGKGLLALAATLAVGGLVFIGALAGLQYVYNKAGLRPNGVSDILGTIAMAMTASAGIMLAAGVVGAFFMEPASATTLLLAIGAGLVAMSAMLAGGGYLFLQALGFLQKTADKVKLDGNRVEEILGAISIGMVATGAFALVAAGLAAEFLILGLAAVPGMWAASAFLEGPLTDFAKSLGMISSLDINTDQVNEVMSSMAISLLVIGGAVYMFGKKLSWTEIAKGLVVTALIIGGIGYFINEIKDPLQDIFDGFAGIKVSGDMTSLNQKMDVIGKIIDAAQTLGTLAIDAAKIAIFSSLVGDESITDVFGLMSGFISKIGDTITGLVTKLQEVSAGIPVEQLPGLESIANIIGAVAALASSLIGPLSQINENSGVFDQLFGPGLSERMSQMTTGVGTLLEAIIGKEGGDNMIKKIVAAVMSATQGIDAGVLKAKAEALKAVFEGIDAVIVAVTGIIASGNDNRTFVEKMTGAGPTNAVMKMFVQVAQMFGDGSKDSGFVRMFNSISGALAAVTIDTSVVGKLEKLADIMTGTMDQIDVISDALLNDNLHDKMRYITSYLDDSVFSMSIKPSDAVAAIAAEAELIGKYLKSMEIDLQKIEMEPKLNSIMAVSGKQEIIVKPGAVNMTVNFNVTMDAEQLAATMHQGNDKTNNKGFFVLTEEAKKSEAFSGDQ